MAKISSHGIEQLKALVHTILSLNVGMTKERLKKSKGHGVGHRDEEGLTSMVREPGYGGLLSGCIM